MLIFYAISVPKYKKMFCKKYEKNSNLRISFFPVFILGRSEVFYP